MTLGLDVGCSATARLGHLNLSVAIYLRKLVNTSPVLMQGILKGEGKKKREERKKCYAKLSLTIITSRAT